jgi:hypothetical protein
MKKLPWCLLGIVVIVYRRANQRHVDRIYKDGVEIVINHLEPLKIKDQASTFSLEKILSIDMERDDLAEAGLRSAGEWDADNDGNIFIIGFKNRENFINRVDPSGLLAGSFGRRGQGPGELQWRVSGNRIIIANEARGYEILVFDFDGNLVRKIRKEYRPVKVTDEIKEAILGPEYRKSGIPQDEYFPNPLPPLNQFFR